MQRRLFLLLLILIGAMVRPIAQPTMTATNTSEAYRLADRIAQETFDKQKFPGMAVMVWKDNEVVFSKGYGHADVAEELTIDLDKSLFRIGSVSKPYTATALGLLYEEGKINLDAHIQTYVPDFPKKEYDISLRQLAGHLAGIRHYRGLEFMMNRHFPTVTEGLSIFSDDALTHQPGSKYAYSSYGWNLISAAIESASGQDFLTYMREKVFDKIGMSNTHADYATKDIEGRVQFYVKAPDGSNQIAPPVDNSYKWAGGGFISSPNDVIKFAKAHLDYSILSKETVDLWIRSQTTTNGKETNYGIGWRSGKDNKGRRWFGHSGGSVGGSTMMLIYPEERIIVVTVVNLSSAKTGNLAFRVGNQFMQ